jgi:hypothetical protein
MVTPLVKKFSALFGTQMFITVFTTARQWSISWGRWIQSPPSHSISLISNQPNIIFPSTRRSSQFACYCFQWTCPMHTANIACSKSHIHFLLSTSFQRIRPISRSRVTVRNKLFLYVEEFLAPRPTPKLKDHPFSVVRERSFPLSAGRRRAMSWWQGPT